LTNALLTDRFFFLSSFFVIHGRLFSVYYCFPSFVSAENLYFKNSVDLDKYPGSGRMVARMVLIHMIIAGTAFVLSFPPALVEEMRRHHDSAMDIPFLQILIGSVMNWLGSVAAYVFLASVDTALTYNIAKIAQRMMLIVLSVVIFHNPITLTNGAGIVVALFGVFLYTVAAKSGGHGKKSGTDAKIFIDGGAHRV
jgi:drug/metabolite transporter (DMT)-like permease